MNTTPGVTAVYPGTFVREIAMLGGDVGKFVAPPVLQRLQAKKQQRDTQAALPHTGAKGG